MYLKRKIDAFLEKWSQDPDRKPLVIKGARQIGKTESIMQFANAHYESVININFALEPKYRSIAQDDYSTDAIIKAISLIDPSGRFIPGRTLIFFDELQEYPEIATALKSFKNDGRFDVICSGSMLGINYKRIESVSVGYKTDFQMYSMDFEEFLWARGYGDDVTADMLSHMLEGSPFSNLEHSLYYELFLDYCTLGGMPEVVRSYVEKGTFEGTLELQRQLVADYREDIQRYAEGVDKARITNVFDSIPAQLAKENKKYQSSKVEGAGRFVEYRGCLDWLQTAGMVNLCYCLGYPELPLKGNFNPDKLKAYYADTGLLIAQLDDEAQEDFRANRNLGVDKGALYESICAEALVKDGYGLFYYKRNNSTLEQDFFVRTASSLVPVEVKARDGRAKSMRTLISSDAYPDITWGIKLHAGNVGANGAVRTFPYFCAFLLRRYLQKQA